MAKALDYSRGRVTSIRNEMILFGSHGVDVRNVFQGAWDKLLPLVETSIEIAEEEDMMLVVETDHNTMIISASLGRNLIDELGTAPLEVLLGACNSLYCRQRAFREDYQALRGGHLGHIHLKDAVTDILKATVACAPFGEGHMGSYMAILVESIKADNHPSVISLESAPS